MYPLSMFFKVIKPIIDLDKSNKPLLMINVWKNKPAGDLANTPPSRSSLLQNDRLDIFSSSALTRHLFQLSGFLTCRSRSRSSIKPYWSNICFKISRHSQPKQNIHRLVYSHGNTDRSIQMTRGPSLPACCIVDCLPSLKARAFPKRWRRVVAILDISLNT